MSYRAEPSPAARVLAAATAVVAGAQIDIAAEREAADVAEAVVATEKSVLQAARIAASAASDARDRSAGAAAGAAQKLADTAARTATGLQIRADELAQQVAAAAVEAAETVSASTAFGGDPEALRTALRIAATVDALAIVTAEQTALAAVAVATAVSTAAVHAAFAAAATAAALEQEVANAATAVKMIATTTARELAVDTDAKAVGIAFAARRLNASRSYGKGVGRTASHQQDREHLVPIPDPTKLTPTREHDGDQPLRTVQRRVQFVALLQLAENGKANRRTTAAICPDAQPGDFESALGCLVDEGSIQGPTGQPGSLAALAESGQFVLTARGQLRLDEDDV